MDGPLGGLRLFADAAGLRGIDFMGARDARPLPGGWRRDGAALARAVEQLGAYFAGRLRDFDLALAPQGTPFQQRVWRALCEIPYGATTTYGELAAGLGNPSASRAVGLANGRNPIPIVIPCHRVIGRDGTLVGYGGGLPMKQRLLALEGVKTVRQLSLAELSR
jgi:methylated-DNA-[protein]-cysteine S-methyltransferase